MEHLTPPLRVEVVASTDGSSEPERMLLAMLDDAGDRMSLSLIALGETGLLAPAIAAHRAGASTSLDPVETTDGRSLMPAMEPRRR